MQQEHFLTSKAKGLLTYSLEHIYKADGAIAWQNRYIVVLFSFKKSFYVK